jgi:hypothetical protein
MVTPIQHTFPGSQKYLAMAERSTFGGGLGAMLGRALKTGGKVAAFGALAPLGTMALLSLIEARDEAKEKMTRNKHFEAVLDEAPSLREDRVNAMKHFRTLRRLAPDISKDPMLSAGYIKKVKSYQNEGVDPSLVAPLLLRQPVDSMKKWEVASRQMPQTKVDIPSWEL